MQVVIWFAGLRGAIAFALAFNMPTPNANWDRGVIISTTLAVIFFTTLVCGGLTEPLLRKLDMQGAPQHAESSADESLVAYQVGGVPGWGQGWGGWMLRVDLTLAHGVLLPPRPPPHPTALHPTTLRAHQQLATSDGVDHHHQHEHVEERHRATGFHLKWKLFDRRCAWRPLSPNGRSMTAARRPPPAVQVHEALLRRPRAAHGPLGCRRGGCDGKGNADAAGDGV